jgi:hypothetical protein
MTEHFNFVKHYSALLERVIPLCLPCSLEYYPLPNYNDYDIQVWSVQDDGWISFLAKGSPCPLVVHATFHPEEANGLEDDNAVVAGMTHHDWANRDAEQMVQKMMDFIQQHL